MIERIISVTPDTAKSASMQPYKNTGQPCPAALTLDAVKYFVDLERRPAVLLTYITFEYRRAISE